MDSMNSLQLEREVLSILFSDKDACDGYIETIKTEYFFSRSLRIIFSTMQRLYKEKKPVDLTLVRNDLLKSGLLVEAGGEDELAEISMLSTNPECFGEYIQELKTMWQKREIRRFAIGLAESNKEVKDISADVERFFSEINASSTEKGLERFGEILQEVYFPMMDERIKKEKQIGIPTGFKTVDRLTGGFAKGNLVIMAARPSVGKTTLAVNMAMNVAMRNIPVYIFSIEMTSVQLVDRIISSVTHIDSNRLKTGDLSIHMQQELVAGSGTLYRIPLYIDQTGTITPQEIRQRIKKKIKETREYPGLVVIDHLQLLHMQLKGRRFENREKEMAEISRYFKSMAKELGTTVLAISQLSRDSDKRWKDGSGRKPRLSDLRDSGALEQDADIVYLIHRPKAYDASANEEEDENACELILAKSRDGQTGVIPMSFEGKFYQFSEITKEF